VPDHSLHTTLDRLPRGARAVLRHIRSAEARIALLNMGVMPGDLIELTDLTLGGCPIAFRVRSTKIALRRAVAATVEVERVEETAPLNGAPRP